MTYAVRGPVILSISCKNDKPAMQMSELQTVMLLMILQLCKNCKLLSGVIDDSCEALANSLGYCSFAPRNLSPMHSSLKRIENSLSRSMRFIPKWKKTF